MPDNNYINGFGTGSASVSNFPKMVLQSDIAPASATITKVDAIDTVVTIANANTKRRGLIIKNDGNQPLYIAFGSVASTLVYTDWIAAGKTWAMPNGIYSGLITGFWISPSGLSQTAQPGIINGSAMVTELYTN